MKHPNCFHQCSGNCRRVGCNCECGEFHDTFPQEELDNFKRASCSCHGLKDHEKDNCRCCAGGEPCPLG